MKCQSTINIKTFIALNGDHVQQQPDNLESVLWVICYTVSIIKYYSIQDYSLRIGVG